MPQYRIELTDGRVFEVEVDGEQPPTEQEILAHLGESSQAPKVWQPGDPVTWTPADPKDFTPQTGPEGSALGRFASRAWENINPIGIFKGLTQAVAHPLDTAAAIGQAQGEQFSKAATAAQEGRYSEMFGHGLAGALPLVGPAAAAAGESFGQGDMAGGLGAGAGLLLPFAGTQAVKSASRAFPVNVRGRVAGALDQGAANRVTDVMAPKVGPNKTRFGRQAEKVAPALAKDASLASWSREGLHAKVVERLADAESALDAAAQARNANQVVHTKGIIDALKQKRAALTSQTHKVGAFKAGQDVVPGPNAARVAQIDQAIEEIGALGPVANYEALRRIRQAYDGPAKAVYSPSMTADYLKAQGGKLGAADVTGVLRDTLAKMDPQTAAANADYHLYRTANDVLEATAEVERTRPKVGRQIIARSTGTIIGGHQAGVVGAVAGFALGPILESALSSGVTTKLQTARLMSQLADALRAGNTAQATKIQDTLRRLATTAARQVPDPAAALSPALAEREERPPASVQR